MNLEILGLGLFGSHALLMSVDESFHRRRGLKPWERWGHPLDTLTVLVVILFALTNEFNKFNLWIYGALSIFSTLFVTKDEWIHQQDCGPIEHWLHSLLFILHPLIFLVVYQFWSEGVFPNWFKFIPYLILSFGLYQLLYWNFLRRNHDR
jgi:hypothetical protein